MSLQPIIDAIALQADDVLAGADNRAQARAGVSEMITLDYSHLNAVERQKVTDGVMDILEREDFFNATPGSGSGDDIE